MSGSTENVVRYNYGRWKRAVTMGRKNSRFVAMIRLEEWKITSASFTLWPEPKCGSELGSSGITLDFPVECSTAR